MLLAFEHHFLPTMRRCAALLLLFLALPAAAAPTAPGKWVRFGGGKAEVRLPAKLEARTESDGALVATFGAAGKNRLELSLLDHEQDPGRRDTAEHFIEFYGRQKNLPVHSDGTKAVVMEGAETEIGGKPHRIARWQIGFGKSIVVMTLTAPVSPTMDPALKEFLDRDLAGVIASVRRTKAE